MSSHGHSSIREHVEELYRTDSRRIFATLIRLLGDFDRAEEAMHDAFATAMISWEKEGIPQNPRAWLVSTGRFKAIDAMRRRAKFDASLGEFANRLDREPRDQHPLDDDHVADDQLRLIFTCCHPALSPESQVALTLREVCGLQTEEIACAFLAPPSTIAQRIVRGKAKIRDAGIPYEVPRRSELPDRIESVLSVIYLVFNEGYSASSGEQVTRADLSGEAIRLGRLVVELLPDAEAIGLLALMLLQESRRSARTTPEGDLILLEDQDRTLWNRDLIREGIRRVEEAFQKSEIGPYSVQAAIAATHAQASSPDQTDWNRIVALYDLLLTGSRSPVIELNRAVAVAMRDGPASGLELIDFILSRGELGDYHLIHAARADLYRRLGRIEEAVRAYETALPLTKQKPERRFIEKRLSEMRSATTPTDC